MLRGNHECASVSRQYGFYDECKRRCSIKTWKRFCDAFNCMPICGRIDDQIMCMHGGLSPGLTDFSQLHQVARPTEVPAQGVMCDLLWSDPEKDIKGWAPSDRGISYVFGPDVVSEFLAKHQMDLIVRGHQVTEDGYEFFANRRLVTIFSAPNYCGEFDNAGAFMEVDESLSCSFKVLNSAVAVSRRTKLSERPRVINPHLRQRMC